MEKQQHSISINAPREKVWNILWADQTYRQWTTPFMEGSYAVTDWQKGSKALFLGPDGGGMVARIEDNIPNEYLSIEHLGMVENGVEDTESDKVKEWAGAHENYTLKDVDGQTELLIEIDVNQEYAQMFNDMWPKALQKVKELAEHN
jgi:uncharacterized protein YndB with AHSA1/START domain